MRQPVVRASALLFLGKLQAMMSLYDDAEKTFIRIVSEYSKFELPGGSCRDRKTGDWRGELPVRRRSLEEHVDGHERQ